MVMWLDGKGDAKMQKRGGENGGGLWGLCSDEEKQASPRGSQDDESLECLGSAGKPEKHSRGWKVIGSSPLLPHTVET